MKTIAGRRPDPPPLSARPAAPALSAAPGRATTVPCIDSGQLFQQGSTVHIEHAGQCYVLRVTRENKLILTK